MDAYRDCTNHDGNLAKVPDHVIHNLLIETEMVTAPVYIGLNDVVMEGMFKWIGDEEELGAFRNWGPNQPGDEFYHQDEDCVEMKVSGDWNDIKCEHVFPPVCETARKTRGNKITPPFYILTL